MFIAFMFHTNKDHYHTEEAIKQYFPSYLIAYEDKPYSHYHAVVSDPTGTGWVRFRQNILITKLGLNGRATKEKPRQYGKLNRIQDIDKIISYTIKDGEYIKSDNFEITEDQIKNSFKKTDKREVLLHLQEYIKNKSLNIFGNIKDYSEFKMKTLIVEYLRENQIQISKHKIERLYIQLINSKGPPFEKSPKFIIEYFFPWSSQNNSN